MYARIRDKNPLSQQGDFKLPLLGILASDVVTGGFVPDDK
jgi:hypothetical protein